MLTCSPTGTVAEEQQRLVSTLRDILEVEGWQEGKGLQERMAELLGVAEGTISRWLKGGDKSPEAGGGKTPEAGNDGGEPPGLKA